MSPQLISLFRFHIENRRFDDGTIRVLETLLASSDVRSLSQVRSELQQLMRSELVRVIREISAKSVHQKLLIVEFLVRVFALVDDVEGCLALRYEALVLRDNEAIRESWLEVSSSEWLSFAEQSLDNGFYRIANLACDKALQCIKTSRALHLGADGFLESDHVEKIKRLKDVAAVSASSRSVQAQAAEYLKTKTVESSLEHALVNTNTPISGSILFLNGIRRRNVRILQKHQLLEPTICCNMANDF